MDNEVETAYEEFKKITGKNNFNDFGEITKEYRKKALSWHPDKTSHASIDEIEVLTANFRDLNSAYDVLKKKQDYVNEMLQKIAASPHRETYSSSSASIPTTDPFANTRTERASAVPPFTNTWPQQTSAGQEGDTRDDSTQRVQKLKRGRETLPYYFEIDREAWRKQNKANAERELELAKAKLANMINKELEKTVNPVNPTIINPFSGSVPAFGKLLFGDKKKGGKKTSKNNKAKQSKKSNKRKKSKKNGNKNQTKKRGRKN